MVQTEMSKVWRFLTAFHPGLAGLVDTGRDGPGSYVDAVRHAIRQESWMKTEKSVNLGAGEGLKEATQPIPLQVYGNRRGDKRLGFQSRKLNRQNKSGRSSGKPQIGSKRKNRPGNQGRLEQFGGGKQAR